MKKSIKLLAAGLLIAGLNQGVFAAEEASANINTANKIATATETTTSSAPAAAAKPTHAIDMSNVLQQLQKVGYIVKSAEVNVDGTFKVDAVDRHGDKQNLDVAANGLTTDQKKVPHETTLAQAAKKVERNGSHVKSIQANTDNYTVVVVDAKGTEQTYTIDLKTGKVSS